jgi:hypothetical protein
VLLKQENCLAVSLAVSRSSSRAYILRCVMMIFVMEKCYAFFAVRNEFLNTI